MLVAAVLRLIADLQIPSVRIGDVPALEVVADHVRPGFQTALLELRLHLVGVPGLHAPGDVIDHAGDRRTCRLPRLAVPGRLHAGRRLRVRRGVAPVADDDTADVANLQRALTR